jgi:hypothetical protein
LRTKATEFIFLSKEIKKLASKFENKHLKLSETIAQKLEAETARLSRVIKQVQDELRVAKTTVQDFASHPTSAT